MAEDKKDAPIIVKKVKKGGHGHHGGAWKVALADFMTSMMAFFLLMWLLNATPQKSLQGLADYFAPTSVSASNSGGGDILSGTTISESKANGSGGVPNKSKDISSAKVPPVDDDDVKAGKPSGSVENTTSKVVSEEELSAPENPSKKENKDKQENQDFTKAIQRLAQEVKKDAKTKGLSDNILTDIIPEGLRIQIVDKNGTDMFPTGSTLLNEHAFELLARVNRVIKDMPNKIAIQGHTQKILYHNEKNPNWMLSAQRANAARLAFKALGLDPTKIARVTGMGGSAPLNPKDPMASENRRISIILLRKKWSPNGTPATPLSNIKTASDIMEGKSQLLNPDEIKGKGTSPDQDGKNIDNLFKQIDK